MSVADSSILTIWTEKDIGILMNYLTETKHTFEKPTPKAYYRVVLKRDVIKVDWRKVQWLVGIYKDVYRYARDWAEASLAANAEDTPIILRELLVRCKYFVELNYVFDEDNKTIVNLVSRMAGAGDVIGIGMDIPNIEGEDADIPQQHNVEMIEDAVTLEPTNPNPDNTVHEQISDTVGLVNEYENDGKEVPKTAKIIQPDESISFGSCCEQKLLNVITNLVQKECQSQRDAILEQTNLIAAQLLTLSLDRAKAQKLDLKMQRKNLRFQQEIERKKLRFKEKELEMLLEKQKKDYELRLMEIESRERVAKFEVNMKYKCKCSPFVDSDDDALDDVDSECLLKKN